MSNIISPLEVYLIVQADGFKAAVNEVSSAVGVVSVIFTIMLFVSLVNPTGCTEQYIKFMKRAKWLYYPLAAMFLGAYFLTPTTKDLCYVFGIPAVVNNEKVQKLAGTGMNSAQLSTEVINKFLENQIDSMTKEKSKPAEQTKPVKPETANPVTEKVKETMTDIALEKAKEALKSK